MRGKAPVLLILLATILPVAAMTPATTQGPAVAAQGGVEERDRVLFSRAEALYRSRQPADALPFLERLVARLEPRLGELGEEGRLMLRRAALYRAILYWRGGERGAADESLDLLVRMDPGYDLEEPAPDGLQERFEARRERLVGFLRVGLFPSDLRVRIDGREIDPVPDLIPLLAGEHTVRAFGAGYAPQQEEVVIRPNRTENIGFELARSSATLQLATRPPGATVVVDGDVMGRTRWPEDAPPEREVPSRPLTVEGLLPGWHELEVSLPDHRVFRQRIEITDLADYELGVVELQPSVGTLVLRELPRQATVRVDGEARTPEWGAGVGDLARLVLPVGDHRLLISGDGMGLHEATVTIADGATATVDVDLRPGIGLVGVLGGDTLDRQALEETLGQRLEVVDGWLLLDRGRAGAAALREAGVAPADLSDPGAGAWAVAREVLEETVPASLFLLAILPEDGGTTATAWVWVPEPGPSEPVSFPLPLGDSDAVEALAARLESALPGPAPWFGAVVVDSRLDPAPVVVAVSSGSPAATAGLEPGDRILALDGEELEGATDLAHRLESRPPFAGVTLQRRRGDTPGVATLTLGRSPRASGPTSRQAAPFVWAAASARLGRADTTTPSWTLELQRGQALMGAGRWRRAAELLGSIQAPGGQPFGAGAVSYWLGVCWLEAAEPDLERAGAALERAAADSAARLGSHDGPPVAPRARARLAEIRTPEPDVDG